jgi:CRP-like cAMP-binding protein
MKRLRAAKPRLLTPIAASAQRARSALPGEARANRLLSLLPKNDYVLLRPHLRTVDLDYKQSLYRAGRAIRQVYFIEAGVGSLVSVMANGDAAEVGTIGNEGLVGLPIVFGDDRGPTTVYVQVPGNGLVIDALPFANALAQSASLRAVMLRYAHVFFNQVAQSAACNQFHSLSQRCCRWLLMTHDRMEGDEFLLTQEFLAMMLGVQRTGVTLAARKLQDAGTIHYRRGVVTILDRRALERGACECYMASKGEFDRFLGKRRLRGAAAHAGGGRRLAGPLSMRGWLRALPEYDAIRA